MNKILVTGAAGFIGFHLVKRLLDENRLVYGIDNINDYYNQDLKINRLQILKRFKEFRFKKMDLENRLGLEKVFDDFKPDIVVNLAAQAGVRYSLQNPEKYISANINGFFNVIDLCRKKNIEGLIYASSSSVYGESTSTPFSINQNVDKPISLYAATKKSNELISYSYSHLFGLKTTGLRFFTVYGPWGRPDMAYYSFTNNIVNGRKIDVYNYGDMKRDFTYIDDIINGTISAIDQNYQCEIFNLGNNKSEKLTDMIKIIEARVNIKANINFLPMQKGDVKETFADIGHSKTHLQFEPKTSLSDGLDMFIDWYIKYNKINS